jgi:hypothetical protein
LVGRSHVYKRVLLLEAWRMNEQQHGTSESVAAVTAKMPRRVRKKRAILGDDGVRLRSPPPVSGV